MRTLPLALTLALVLPSIAHADDTGVRNIPPGDDVIVVIRAGDKAPINGQLFDQATALRWSNWLLQYKLRLDTDVAYQKRVDQVEIDYWKRINTLEQEKYKLVTVDYQQKIADLQKVVVTLNDEVRDPPFYKAPWFGFVIGVVVTGVAVGAGAAIVGAAK